MPATVEAPLDLVESFAALRFPPKADARLQVLMDRNTDGRLGAAERDELESLVELSESLSLLRAQALHVLGRREPPGVGHRPAGAGPGGRPVRVLPHAPVVAGGDVPPRTHHPGGPATVDNLCLACPGCNLHKSDRIAATDPDTGEAVRLFHPRRDRWADHFTWHASELTGRTPSGRATAAVLDLNARRLRIRQAERLLDLFPPDD